MKIAQSETRNKYPLSRKKVVKKTVVGSLSCFIFWLFLSVPTIIILSLSKDLSWLTAIAAVGLLILLLIIVSLIYLYQLWYFSVYYYDLTGDFIIIKKGPITPIEITIPYERVQDVYVDQDIFDRIFDIYDVHLSSATISSGMEAHIDGVEKEAADGLRGVLLNTVSAKIRKNRPQNSNDQKS